MALDTNEIGSDILLIGGEKMPFITRALLNEFSESHISFDQQNFDLNLMEKRENYPPITIICTEKLTWDIQKVLMYIRDKCIAKRRKVILIGYRDSNTDYRRILTDVVVSEAFERPLEVKDVAKKVLSILETTLTKNEKRSILIVDDQPVFLRTAMGWFENDYNVMVAPSVSKAIKVFANNTVDLLLLDYEMPDFSGDKLFEIVKKDQKAKRTPVIFLTSKRDPATVKRLLELKPEGYILKSTPSEEIVKYVEEYFAKHG